jgi:outer membrane protein OmpA-like peptidoglycan-associated protein
MTPNASSIVPVSLLAALALGAGGCAPTTNPYTGEQQVSKTAQGAGIGAVSGALIGGVIGNNRGSGDQMKGAAWGAAAGALLGAGIGNYMDQQEAAIRAELEGTGVSVTRNGNDIVLNMPQDITFATGRDEIRSDFGRTLNAVALVLNKYNRTLVHVAGHTDSDGGTSYNQDLSERRAGAVARYLSGSRVDPRRLIVRGYGESSPIASNSTASGKAANRRVEIRIVPQQ